jgi:hypothetical protein
MMPTGSGVIAARWRTRRPPILAHMEKMPPFPSTDKCFICNQPIRFNEEGFEVTFSLLDWLPGASRPSAFLWSHETCAREAAHADFRFPPGDNT